MPSTLPMPNPFWMRLIMALSKLIRQSNAATARGESIDDNDQDLTSPLGKTCRAEESRRLQELFVTDPTSDRDAIVIANGGMVPSTCDWITTTDAFVGWKQSESGLLWVHGGPGKGKTYLSIYLTKSFEERSSNVGGAGWFNGNGGGAVYG
ncbi:hypothetical protein QBC44DRAFT_380316 [Cladorrhinum sp. PSN332]|nr:hypothetical protein QBC44DRAFT_380316 [Cladorrhinum sp. PSN332]